MFNSCDESLSEDTIRDFNLELSRDTLLFNVGGGIKSVEIFTNQDAWTAEYDNTDWYTASEYRDADGYEMLTIEAESSDELETRESLVNITAGPYSKELYIIQLGNAPSIMFENERVEVDKDTTVVDINYVANIDFTISNASTWVTTELIEDMGETILRLKIGKNETGANREYALMFNQVGGEYTAVLNVVQSATLSGYEPASVDEVTGNKKIPVISGTSSSTLGDFDISKSFDGDYMSYFQSDYQETEKLEFSYKLDAGDDMLNYIVYYPSEEAQSQSMRFGNIYVKKVGEDTFTKVLSMQSFYQADPKVFEFANPIENVDEVKFEVVLSFAPSGTIPSVSCAEVEFYTSAVIYDNIFTDITYSELLPDVTIDAILNIDNEFYRNIAKHLLNGTYEYERILDLQPIQSDRVNAKINKASLYEYATGIYFETGQDVVVFCGEQSGASPSLIVLNTNGTTQYPLKEGVNKISVAHGGKVYVNNPTALKVHIASGILEGVFNSNNIDDIQNLEARDYNVVDIVSENYHLIAPLSYAQTTLANIVNAGTNLDAFIANAKTFYAVNEGAYIVNSKLGIVLNETDLNLGSVVNLTTNQLETLVNYTTGYDETVFNVLEAIGEAYEPYVNRAWTQAGVSAKLFALDYFYYNGGYSVLKQNNIYAQAFQDIIVTDLNYNNAESVWSQVVPLWQLNYYAKELLGVSDYYAQMATKVKALSSVSTNYTTHLKAFTTEVLNLNFNGFFNVWNMGTTTTAIVEEAPAGLAYFAEDNKAAYITPADVIQGSFFPSLGGYPTLYGYKNVVALEVYNAGFLAHVAIVGDGGSFYKLTWPEFKSNMKIVAIGSKGDRIQVN
ncbi:M60 family metallopeptidase [Aestuariibaculum suncheonense]